MGEVLARLGGSGRALEFRVFDCYTRVVGATFRARTLPERLAGTTLFVRVDFVGAGTRADAAAGRILARMATELGPGIVTELRTRVGQRPARKMKAVVCGRWRRCWFRRRRWRRAPLPAS